MMRSLQLPSRRARTSCSILALATVLVVGATPVSAQSFLGTGTPTNGAATTINTGPGTTTITVTTPQTVINWLPTDNASGGAASNTPIAFQNSGTTATFLGMGNYAVLNNIVAADLSRVITMNGTINAGALGAGVAANGSIYFYAPSGILLGGNSMINVGSLVLSASPILVDGGGNFINGAANQVIFGLAPRATAAISTVAGSQINATATDAYVAMVAPRVEHRGGINVAGSAALVGAEAATINFSPDGLFDIQVTTGTTDANGVFVSGGTITGPASTGAADIHRAYLVAVPKNSALTLAINQGGSLGFDIAGAANVVGNTVVLSAGHDIVDGNIQTFKSVAGGNFDANLNVAATSVTSAVNAVASGSARLFAASGPTSNYASDVSIRGFTETFVSANPGATLNIAGNLTMSNIHEATAAGQSNTGGFVALYASTGGTVNIAGNASLTSIGYGGSSLTPGLSAGSGTGGTVWVQSEGDSILAIAGNLSAFSTGQGGSSGATGANAGDAAGGEVRIRTFGVDSVLTVGGTTNAHASGNAGNATFCVGCTTSGGNATGGTVLITSGSAAGSALTLTGAVSTSATAQGGFSANGGAGGSGTGGTITVSAGAGSTLLLSNNFGADTSGYGSYGATGGDGEGGTITVESSGTQTITGASNLAANGVGGTGLSALAGAAQGGNITVGAANGGNLTLNGFLSATANATGGSANGAGADGGDATGGFVRLQATGNGSVLTTKGAFLQANAQGGRGDGLECFTCDGDGGDGQGGEIDILSSGSTGISGNSIISTGNITAIADGTGGSAAAASAIAGDGFGGEASYYVGTLGTMTLTGNLYLQAAGIGGNHVSGDGGYGFGGEADLTGQIGATSGTIVINGNVELGSDALGGNSVDAGTAAGDAFGNDAFIFSNMTSITVNGAVNVHSNGIGGSSTSGSGGAGFGGQSRLTSYNSLTITGGATVVADATGGAGGAGGDAFGGDVYIRAENGGNLDLLGPVNLFSNSAIGGLGTNGDGGDAFSGFDNNIYADGAGSVLTISGATTARSNATGGASNSAIGGDAFGDDIDIYAQNGGNLLFESSLTATSDAIGGAGATGGGDAFGGYIGLFNLAVLQVDGALTASTNATGGDGGSGVGGIANAGDILISAQGGTSLTIGGNVTATAEATGGDGATGGEASGGDISVEAVTGGDLSLLGASNLFSSDDFGGNATGSGVGGATTDGGDTNIYAAGVGSTLTVSGATTVTSNATGGDSEGNVGGAAQGGDIDVLNPNGGIVSFGNNLTINANATGGAGATGGGYAQGGTPSLGSFGLLEVDGALTMTANAIGGLIYDTDSSGFSAGNALGGTVRVVAQASTLIVGGAVNLTATGTGGAALDNNDFSGNGEGGTVQLGSTAGGTLDLLSSLTATALGRGGSTGGFGLLGGNGIGGEVRVQATAANASVTVAGAAYLDASGEAASGGGGDGIGGDVFAEAFGAATASLDFLGDVSLYANGYGANGAGTGGYGEGGEALLQATAGATVSVGGNATLNTDAYGGYNSSSSGTGGNALGGTSRIQAYVDPTTLLGGTITVDGSAYLGATGYGGESYAEVGGQGGVGTGGTAQLYAFGSNVTIGAPASGGGAYLRSDGVGGDADDGTGGDGFGGTLAEIAAINGDITIDGYASVSASGFGGDGGQGGGDGLGSGTYDRMTAIGTGGAHIVAQNGDIVIKGGAGVSAVGVGGDTQSEFGYGGDYGGAGGDGTGGFASIKAFNSNAGPSLISIIGNASESSGTAIVNVDGTGGNGGTGVGGFDGGDGGDGGNGVGGDGFIIASAGNGTVAIDAASILARGTGGTGGSGGTADGGIGGDGGNGGNATGGFINIGTASGNGQSAGVNNGFGDYGSILADVSATGGAGGNGSFGSPSGNGGDGGDAVGGGVALLVRGSRVDVDTALLKANATGGNGGFLGGITGITGIGGDATVGGDGGIGVVITDRFLIPAHRGTLNAGDITGTAIAIGGIGIPNGASNNLGGSQVIFRNADGNIGSLDFLIDLGINASNSGIDMISVIDGNVVVDGEFSFSTSGNLSLFANNGDMHIGALNLSAGNFVFDPVNDPAPDPGTYFADSATILTGNNFVTTANLDVGSSLIIDAPGMIDAANFTIGADLDLLANGGDLTVGILDVTGAANLYALGAIDIISADVGFFRAEAGGTVDSGAIVSDTNIQIQAGGNVTLTTLNAGLTINPMLSNKAIRIDTLGSVLVGEIVALGGIDITADGSVTGTNVTTGDVLFTDAGGAIFYDNISAGLVNPQVLTEPVSVGLNSATSIDVGDIEAQGGIAFVTSGPLTTGNLTSGGDILGLVSGDIVFGDIDADGRVFLADSSMFTDAGGLIGEGVDSDIDIDSIFAATPVATGGSILFDGPVVAGSLQAAAGTTITAGTIVANGLIDLSTDTGFILTQAITNTGDTSLDAGTTINVGAIDSGGGRVSLVAGGDINGSTITAGSIFAQSGGSILLGDLTAIGTLLLAFAPSGGIDLSAADSITVGDLDAAGPISLTADTGFIQTQSITNTGDTVLTAGTTISIGALDSGNGAVTLLAGGFIGGDVVDAGSIYAESGDTINLGNLTAPGDIELYAASDITVDNVLAGETIDMESGGAVNGGTMTAGDSLYIEAAGLVDLLAISAGLVNPSQSVDADYNVGILSGATIDTGNIAAANHIGLGALGNITTGTINAGDIFMVLSGGNMSFGTIVSGGPTYLADDSMIALGGATADFDPNPILAAVPTPSGGSILLRGTVTAGSFTAAAGTTLTGTTIDADGSIYTASGGNIALTDLDAGGNIFQRAGGTIVQDDLNAGGYIDARSVGGIMLGDLVAGDYIDLRSNNAISLGNATSGETINFLTGGTLTGLVMTAGDQVLGEATGAIQLGNVTAGITNPSSSPTAEYGARFSSSGAINIGNVNAAGRIGFGTPTTLVTGNLTSGDGLMALVGGNMSLGTINASAYVYLANHSMAALGGTFPTFNRAPILALAPVATGGSIALGGPVNTGRFEAAAGTTLTGTTINSGGLLYATSGGNMTLTDLSAFGDVVLTSGGNISVGNIFADDDIALNATGSIFALDIFAYDDVSADAGTTITTDDVTGNSINLFADGNINTENLLTQAAGVGPLALLPGTSITVQSGGNVDVGTIEAIDGVHVSAVGTILAGTIDAEDFVELFAGGNITAGTINAGGDIDIFSDTGLLDLEDLHAGMQVDLETEGSLQFGDVTADDLNFEIGGSVDGGNIDAISHADGHAGGAIVLENITVTGPPSDDDFSIGITSETSISVENVAGFDLVGFATSGDLTTGNVTAGSLFLALAGGDIVTGSITTGSGGQVYMANASMCGTVCGGDDEVNDVEAADILALAPVPTGGLINIQGPVETGLFQAAAGTTFTAVADINADGSVDISSGGAMQLQDVTAGDALRLTSGATIDGGDLTAGSLVRVAATGAVDVGDITIDGGIQVIDGFQTFDVGSGSPIEVFGGSIITGNISTDGYVGLYTPGDLTVGTIDAGHHVIALVGDDASFGAITTPEHFFLAGYEMFSLVTGGEGFNPEAVFAAAQKSATDGSATFAGQSSADTFEAYVGDDTILASLETDSFGALIDTGGLFTLTGTFTGGTVISNDIDIGANALITDEVTLISRNATGTFIGDGLTGNGYRLSDAEADRIHAGFRIGADVGRGADDLLTIGDLSITRGANDPGDEYGFLVGNESTETESGTIRIVGDVTFNNLLNGELVYFTSETFELDAATGSISLYGQGTTLGGRLSIESDRVWVASETILAKLRANPLYAGRVAELNAPAAVQRPEGVIRAEAIEFGEDEPPSSLLVQNTGTVATPAGFLLNAASIGDDGEGGTIPPGSIDLVINGQVITGTGTVTGIAVRDGLVAEFGSAAFVPLSTINGCVLVGPCTGTPPPPPPVIETVKPTDVQLTDNLGLGDGLFGNEGDIDDGEAGDEGDLSSPIAAPTPLFDSRPLTASGDIDDPVSGAGNPSLYGQPTEEEACDNTKDQTCKAGTKGDGK